MLFGQLGNYWTLQVSTEGTLLSGALVAAKSNNAGFFYNPATISSDSSSSFSFNTSLFRSYFLKYTNPFGENTEMRHSTGNFDPIFLAFLIPRKNKLNVKFGLSIMGKQNTDMRLIDRVYLPNYNFPKIPGTVGDYEGLYNYRLRSSEYWINFSSAKQINEKFSLGFTIIGAIRTLDYILSMASNYVYKDETDNSSTASYKNYTEAYMYNFKLLVKVGAIYNLNDHSRLGLNITSSSLNVFGSGSIERYISQINVRGLVLDSIDIIEDDQLVSDFARDLKVNFKSPLSIALGYNIEYSKHSFGFAVEYFREIKPYKVIIGENRGTLINSSNQIINEEEFLSLTFAQRDILNFAFSYEQYITESFTILTGFRTNFSTSRDINYTGAFRYNHIEDITINYYHLTGGGTFTLLNNKFILGIDLGFNYEKQQENIVNYTIPLVVNNEGIPLRGNIENNATLSNTMLGIVLGYSFQF